MKHDGLKSKIKLSLPFFELFTFLIVQHAYITTSVMTFIEYFEKTVTHNLLLFYSVFTRQDVINWEEPKLTKMKPVV